MEGVIGSGRRADCIGVNLSGRKAGRQAVYLPRYYCSSGSDYSPTTTYLLLTCIIITPYKYYSIACL
ncbi:hypothetical protein PAHAL_1G458400 [Panicum hallii]|uniref:Uncharacterized protein n=1 Tax=Panicum hallii TaxID=206008 RepID=A0A2T8KYN9_9POAL|nr:hypothetical protein PAHAL_1G458400 [Panicum hallii]